MTTLSKIALSTIPVFALMASKDGWLLRPVLLGGQTYKAGTLLTGQEIKALAR